MRFANFTRGLLGLALAAAALLASCQTTAPVSFPTPTPAWQTLTGQAHYSGSRSVVGEVVIRRLGTSEFQLAFSSGPGFPLLTLKESGSQARAEGLFARGSWQGDPRRAPANLNGWISLREIFAKIPSRSGTFSAAGPATGGVTPEVERGTGAETWTAFADIQGGRLAHLTVQFAGGSLNFHFGN